MRRMPCLIPDPAPETLTLTGQDATHIRNVLRMTPGDFLTLFDGAGTDHEAEILSVTTEGVSVRLTGITRTEAAPATEIVIAMGLLKEKKIDDLIPPLTELGVSEIHVFRSSRSIPVLDPKKVTKRLQRWERIATESLKQCRRSRLPRLFYHDSPAPLFTRAAPEEARVLFWEEATMPLASLATASCRRLTAVFGPEGGLSPGEADQFRQAGYVTAGLGPRILKAQTAVVAGATLLQYLYGDLHQPPVGEGAENGKKAE